MSDQCQLYERPYNKQAIEKGLATNLPNRQ